MGPVGWAILGTVTASSLIGGALYFGKN